MNRTHSFDNEAVARLAAIATASDAPPHLISLTEGMRGRKLTAYTATSVSDGKGRKDLLQHLRQSGIEAEFQVVAQPAGKLAKASSIEQLLGLYRGTDYVYDPTGGFTRSKALVEFSHLARATLQEKLNGIFWHSHDQSLYLLLNREHYFQDAKVKVADLSTTESLVQAAMKQACGETDIGFLKSIKLGFDLPAVALLPVDKASFKESAFSLSALKEHSLASALAISPRYGGCFHSCRLRYRACRIRTERQGRRVWWPDRRWQQRA